MLARYAHHITSPDAFVELPGFAAHFSTWVKLEGLNPAGSIKLKPARQLIEDAEASGLLGPGARLIESTSGNLGVSLAVICAAKGYQITLVTDANVNARTAKHIKALGAELVIVRDGESAGGYLQARLELVRSRMAADPALVWLNQYVNPGNPEAHRRQTAPEIFGEFGTPDYLFIGVGTSGTLMGCVSYVREHGLPTRVVAVDAVGSVMFGGSPGHRHIPGLGSSRQPEIYLDDGFFDKILIPESETIRMCRQVARSYGLLLGGSSGTALAAIAASLDRIPAGSTVLALSPDMGYAYLDTVYDDIWVLEHFGLGPLTHAAQSACGESALTRRTDNA